MSDVQTAANAAARLLPTFGRPMTAKELYRLLPGDSPTIRPLLAADNATTLINRALESLQSIGLVVGEKTGRGRFDPMRWTWTGPVDEAPAESAAAEQPQAETIPVAAEIENPAPEPAAGADPSVDPDAWVPDPGFSEPAAKELLPSEPVPGVDEAPDDELERAIAVLRRRATGGRVTLHHIASIRDAVSGAKQLRDQLEALIDGLDAIADELVGLLETSP